MREGSTETKEINHLTSVNVCTSTSGMVGLPITALGRDVVNLDILCASGAYTALLTVLDTTVEVE